MSAADRRWLILGIAALVGFILACILGTGP